MEPVETLNFPQCNNSAIMSSRVRFTSAEVFIAGTQNRLMKIGLYIMAIHYLKISQF